MINDIAGHALAHALYSHIRRGSRARGISRRQARKRSNRKRRWFVDNIIMHHKRLHDRNRELVITNARTRALARRKELEKKPEQLSHSTLRHNRPKSDQRHQDRSALKKRGEELRQRTLMCRVRAERRWSSVMKIDRDKLA